MTGDIFAQNRPSIERFEGIGFEKWAHYPRVADLDGKERDLLLGFRLYARGR